jgi:hypothetical protein
MKLFMTVAAGLLALTLGATSAQAKDKHKKHNNNHDDHSRDGRHYSSERYNAPRVYGSQPYYYSSGKRYYSYDRDPSNGRYYYPRPSITLQIGR